MQGHIRSGPRHMTRIQQRPQAIEGMQGADPLGGGEGAEGGQVLDEPEEEEGREGGREGGRERGKAPESFVYDR